MIRNNKHHLNEEQVKTLTDINPDTEISETSSLAELVNILPPTIERNEKLYNLVIVVKYNKISYISSDNNEKPYLSYGDTQSELIDSVYYLLVDYFKFKSDEEETEYSCNIQTSTYMSVLMKLNKLLNEEKKFTNPDISINSVAAELNTNRTYISNIINKEYKTSFPAYINKLRVEYAVELYNNSEEKPGQYELALESGFTGLTTFHRAFKTIYNCTPKEYLKQFNKTF